MNKRPASWIWSGFHSETNVFGKVIGVRSELFIYNNYNNGRGEELLGSMLIYNNCKAPV